MMEFDSKNVVILHSKYCNPTLHITTIFFRNKFGMAQLSKKVYEKTVYVVPDFYKVAAQQ